MFSQGIVRSPGRNFGDGISTKHGEKPDYEIALQQHELYCHALMQCGIKLTILDPERDHPDGCFVEDTAIVTEEMAVITRPGHLSRRREVETIAELLSEERILEYIRSPATVDGGDILRIQDHFYIGRSTRTNREGARQLRKILERYHFTSSEIPVKSLLHLKTGVTYLGGNDVVSLPPLDRFFLTFNVIRIGAIEKEAANCLRVNDHLLVPMGYPKAQQSMLDLGYEIYVLDISEFQKMDGGLTCLSLIF